MNLGLYNLSASQGSHRYSLLNFLYFHLYTHDTSHSLATSSVEYPKGLGQINFQELRPGYCIRKYYKKNFKLLAPQ